MKKAHKPMAIVLAVALILALTACGVSVTDITVPASVQVAVGDTVPIDITYMDDKNTDQTKLAEAAAKAGVTWEVADTSIATVDGTAVTGVAAGETTLTIHVGDVSKTVAIHVIVPVEGVEAPETLELAINGTDALPLGAKLVPEGATGVTLTYASSDETVATVDDAGIVTAVADGECTVTTTVVAEGAEAPTPPEPLIATTKVIVTTAPTEITLEQNSGTLYVGGTTTLQVYTLPKEAAAPDPTDITYISSNDKVATVDTTGKVTAKAVGKATITVTYGELTTEYQLVVKARSTGGGGTQSSGNGGTQTSTSPSGGSGGGGTQTPSTPSGGGGGTTPPANPDPPAPPAGGGVPDGANPDDHHTSPDMNTDGAGNTVNAGGIFD